MRATNDDYKNIINYCKDSKRSRDIMDKFDFDMNFTSQLLGRMHRNGFLTIEKVPFNGQYRNEYKATSNAQELLNERIKEAEERELRQIEREGTEHKFNPNNKLKPKQLEKEYTVEASTKVLGKGHIRVNGFAGFHGGSGKKSRPKVHVGSTANMI